MGTRRERRTARVNKYFGDMVSKQAIDRIVDGPRETKKQINDECRQILEALGYKKTTMMYGKDRGEGARFL